MGQHVAKARKVARTPTSLVRNVDKVLEAKKTAPRHPSTKKAFDDIIAENPHIKDETKQKHEQLHSKLDQLHVKSTGSNQFVLRKGTTKLSLAREGELNFNQVEKLFLDRKLAPDVWTEEAIAAEYNLDVNVVTNLLAHFGSFHIYEEEKLKGLKREYEDYLEAEEYEKTSRLPSADEIKDYLQGTSGRPQIEDGRKGKDGGQTSNEKLD